MTSKCLQSSLHTSPSVDNVLNFSKASTTCSLTKSSPNEWSKIQLKPSTIHPLFQTSKWHWRLPTSAWPKRVSRLSMHLSWLYQRGFKYASERSSEYSNTYYLEWPMVALMKVGELLKNSWFTYTETFIFAYVWYTWWVKFYLSELFLKGSSQNWQSLWK